MLKRAGIVLCVVAFFSALQGAKAADNLYGAKGVSPDAVRQGRLGSCYFHAVIAALAQRRVDTKFEGTEGRLEVTLGGRLATFPANLKDSVIGPNEIHLAESNPATPRTFATTSIPITPETFCKP